MTELRLDAHHTHLYPGARGTLRGALPEGGEEATCEVAFSDGAVALGTLTMEQATAAVLETGPYATAAGSDPRNRWNASVSPST